MLFASQYLSSTNNFPREYKVSMLSRFSKFQRISNHEITLSVIWNGQNTDKLLRKDKTFLVEIKDARTLERCKELSLIKSYMPISADVYSYNAIFGKGQYSDAYERPYITMNIFLSSLIYYNVRLDEKEVLSRLEIHR